MVRRAVALGVIALVLILLVVGVRGCLDSAKEQSLKDYTGDVTEIVGEANDTTATFFEVLSAGGDSPTDLQTQVNELRVRAEAQTREARGFDVPDEMRDAHRTLLLSLTLIDGAIGRVAEKLPGALASDADAAEDAVTDIAAQMQAFTAADVVYSQRTAALIRETLDDEEIGGQQIQASAFQQNLGWLEPTTVAQRIGAEAGAGAGDRSDQKAAPGLHGHGLTSVAVGDLTLQPGGGANRIPAVGDLAFTVTFANQGENDETDVPVRVRVEGAGDPITVSRTVDQTAPGAEASVSIPLGKPPPIGTPVTIKVEVEGVPGEEKTDNNSQEYAAIFARG